MKRFLVLFSVVFVTIARITSYNVCYTKLLRDIAGQQFKVEKERRIFVHRLSANEGDTVEFEKSYNFV